VPLTPEEDNDSQGKEDREMGEDMWRRHSDNMNQVNFRWKNCQWQVASQTQKVFS